MLAVFELLPAWYQFGCLGRSPTPLDKQPGSSRQSFLSIATVAWFNDKQPSVTRHGTGHQVRRRQINWIHFAPVHLALSNQNRSAITKLASLHVVAGMCNQHFGTAGVNLE